MPSTRTNRDPALVRIDAEWTNRHSRALVDLDQRGIRTAGEWVATYRAVDVTTKDELLLDLLRAAQAGNQPAERAVLKLMMPKIVLHARVAFRRCANPADSKAIALAAGWEAIKTINTDRAPPEKVSRALGMKILNIITSTEHLNPEVSVADEDLTEIVEESMPVPDPFVASSDPIASLVKILSWAVDAKVISRAEVAFLAKTELGERTLVELAEEEGQSYEAFRKRVLRTRKRLTDAIGTHMSRYTAWE